MWNQEKNKKESKLPKYKKSWHVRSGITGVIALGLFLALRSTSFKTKTPVANPIFVTNSMTPVKNKSIGNVIARELKNNQPIATVYANDTAQKLNAILPKELTVDEFIDSVRQAMARQDRRR